MPGREGQEGDIPISQRVIAEQSQATIKTLLDALVELVTNSDDSYRRLESNGLVHAARITAYVRRGRGGIVSEVAIADWAEGMSLERIEEILEFGADQSGFTSGGSIRGLFGKGLKEAVFALGSGQIISVKDGVLSAVTLWQDDATRDYRWRIDKDKHPSSEPNGTQVNIAVSKRGITSPQWKTLQEQFCTHFALRGICFPSRIVELTLQDTNMKSTNRMLYTPAPTRKVVDKYIRVDQLGEVHLELGECEEPLAYSRNNPCSIAGVVVTMEGIPLDNHAFGFENDEAARYFCGSVEVPAIAQALRSNDLGILSPTRTGLDWRSIRATKLQAAVEAELRLLVDRKRRELETERRTATRETYRRRLMDVCDLLNQLAEEEIEDLPRFGREVQLEGLAIRPDIGYARPDEQRRFSIYLPSEMAAPNRNPRVSISIEDVHGGIRPSTNSVTLALHQLHPNILSGSFLIQGTPLGSSCTIYAQWEDEEDIAEFRVREPGTRQPGGEPPCNRGLFREVFFDDQTATPIQRVSFNNGNITIFLNFPTLHNYLGPGGDGMDTPLGSLMCAEMVAEAFSREVARRRIETGIIVPAQGGEIDAYNSELNTLSRKCLDVIHRALVRP